MGNNLSRLRNAAGLSQAKLAAMMREAGFSWHATTVWRIEQGQQELAVREADALSALLGGRVFEGTAATKAHSGGADYLDDVFELLSGSVIPRVQQAAPNDWRLRLAMLGISETRSKLTQVDAQLNAIHRLISDHLGLEEDRATDDE